MADTTPAQEFRLKDGYCQIFPDRIVVVQHQNLQVKSDHHLFRVLMRSVFLGSIFMFIATIMLIFAFKAYQSAPIGSFQFFIFIAITLISVIIAFLTMLAVASNLVNATAGMIHREQITTVKFKHGIPLLINPYFLVKFNNESGKPKKRWLILPNLNQQNEADIAHALTIMRQEKLI